MAAIIVLAWALPSWAANDPKDLSSQNAADANIVEVTGQAHFRIEIPVPKGTGGSEPDLALTYSSNLSDGPFGVGWGVELGEIRRTPRFGTPAYDSTDEFEFDGMLLVEDTANPGEYRTYQESFARITRSVNGLEDQWLVEFPDGRKARFGMDQISRVRRDASLVPENDTDEVGRWLVSELEDVNGNITRFTYNRVIDVGTAYLRSIEYTFREGATTPTGGDDMRRRIFFKLEPRQDEMRRKEVIYGFPLGIETRISYRVGEIQINVGSYVYRRMVLTYAPSAGHDTGRSRLASTQLFGAYCESYLNPVTKCQGFPAKTFTYTDSDELGTGTGAQWDPNEVWHGGTSLHFTQGELWSQGRDRGVRIGDINGDGYPDYVGAWAKAKSDGTWDIGHEVFLNNGSGWGVLDTNWKAELEALRVWLNLVEEVRTGTSANETCSTRDYYASDIPSYLFFRFENPFNLELQGYGKLINPPVEARLVDLNGDGFSDIVVSFEVGAGSSTADSRCGSGSWDAPIKVKQVFINNGIGDAANGGGWTDETAEWGPSLPPFYSIYLRSDGGTGTQTPGPAWMPGQQRGLSGNAGNGVTYAHFFDHGVRMPDLNGDGRPDIVAKRDPATFGSGSAVIDFEEGVWLSDPDGTGWVRDTDYDLPVSIVAEFNFTAGYPKYVNDADAGVRFADVNGDGLADLVKTPVVPIPSHGSLSATLQAEGVWLNTGSGWCGEFSGNPECANAQKYLPPADFTTISEVYQPPSLTMFGGNRALVRSSELAFVDLNGDDKVDLLKTDSANLTGLNAWIHDPSEPLIWVQDDRYVPDNIMATTGRWNEGGDIFIFDNGVRIFDFNGDATIDFMKDRFQTPPAPRAIHVSRTAHVDLLETFDNGQGGIQTLEYTSAIKQRDADFELYAKAHAGPSYADEADFIGLPRWTARSIVSRITTMDTLDGGATHSTTLKYAMPQWDPDTRTLLGFRGVWSIHEDGDGIPNNEPSKITYFWQRPGRTGRPNWITTYHGAERVSERKMTWETLPGSSPDEGSIAGVNIGRLAGETQTNYYEGDAGATQGAIYRYTDGVSPYGYNFVHEIEMIRPTGKLIIKRAADLADTGNKWIKGKVATETHEDEYSELLKQTDYVYDGRGLPTSVTRTIKQRYAADTPMLATTTYLFDEYGNLIRTTDPEDRTTYFCYDGDTNFADTAGCQDGMGTGSHTVVVSVKDPFGEETSFSGSPMDLASGKLTTMNRLYSGDSDWVEVDAFNRPTRRWTQPANQGARTILATREYIDAPLASGNLANRPYIVERSYYDKLSAVDDAATVRTATYVDGFGRRMVSVSPQAPAAAFPFGRAITARDYAGRPTRGTLDIACTDADCDNLAEATGPNVAEITQTYDVIGRVLTRSTPDGDMVFAYGQTDYTPPAGLGAGISVPLDVVLSKDANGVLTEHLLDGNRLVVSNECDSVSANLTDLAGVMCSNADSTFYTYEASGEVNTIYDATGDYGSAANRLTYRYDTLGRVYWIEDPDGGVTFTDYDKVGNVTQTMNTSIGSTTTVLYEYDALDRLMTRNAPNQIGDWDLSVEYDPATRKRSLVTANPGTYIDSWEYDDFGNLKKNVRTMNARTLRTDFNYDLLGRLSTIQSPLASAEGISYGYDGAYLKRVCGVLAISDCEAAQSRYYVDDVQYDALGRAKTISEAPGDLKFDYFTIDDPDDLATGRSVHQVKSMKLNDNGSKLNLAYRYNDGGQVIQVTDGHVPVGTLNATATYDYDRRGRLSSWTAQLHNNQPKYFAYDEIGNLVGRDLDAPNAAWNQFYFDGESGNAGEGGPHAVSTNHKGKSYAYDPAGNVTKRGDDEYITYNSLGQVYCVGAVESACTTFFWYDIDGNLLSKSDASKSEIYLGDYFRFDKLKNIAYTYTSAFGRRIVMQKKMGVSLRPAAVVPPPWSPPIDRDLFFQLLAVAAAIGMYAILAWLGVLDVVEKRPVTASIALVLCVLIAAPPQAWAKRKKGGGSGGGGGSTYTRYLFHDHLGSNVLALSGRGGVKERRIFEPFGEVVASLIDFPAGVQTSFTGKLYHDELSLYNFGARWYDSEAGRFISVDPILQSVPDPQTHNPYTYARNNPIGNIDPDGREYEGSSGGGLGFAVSFLAGAVSSLFGGGGNNSSNLPAVPNGPPAYGDAVVAGNAAGSNGELAQGWESTAMSYGGGSQSDPLGPNPGNFVKVEVLGFDLATPFGGFEVTVIGFFLGRNRAGELQAGPFVEGGPAIGVGLSLDVGGEFITNVDGLDRSLSINFVEGIGPLNAEVNINPNPPNNGNRFFGDFVNGFGGARSFGPLPAEAFISGTQTRAFDAIGFGRRLYQRIVEP